MRRTLTAVIAAATIVGLALAPAPTANADQLGAAKARLARLQDEAALAGEAYDQAREQVAAEEQRADTLAADVASQNRRMYGLQRQAAVVAVQQFQARQVDPVMQVIAGSNPDRVITELSTVAKVQDDQQQILSDYELESAHLADLQREQAAAVQQARDAEAHAPALKKALDSKVDEANNLVSKLTAKQLAAVVGTTGRVDVDQLHLDGVGRPARDAVRYAVKQAGKRYVWGADGPDSFDCSGLTLAAYQQSGINLPHSSLAQSSLGRPVQSVKDLQPGDLLFWYSPVHHVGMYIGDGLFVHARNPQVGVVVQTVSSYPIPITAMRRIAG